MLICQTNVTKYTRSVQVPSDHDGYVALQCPHCSRRFGLRADELASSSRDSLWCPSCGLGGEPVRFATVEFVGALKAEARNLARDAINDAMRSLEKSMRRSKYVTFKRGTPLKPETVVKGVPGPNLDVRFFPCCERHAKVMELDVALDSYCPYCGDAQ